MSCQPRPQPQASGTAAISASRGTATNTATSTRSKTLVRSGMISGLAAARGASSSSARVAVAFVVVVMQSSPTGRDTSVSGLLRIDRVWDQHDSTYFTVAYATVSSGMHAGPLAGRGRDHDLSVIGAGLPEKGRR